MPEIDILLASCNSEKFIREQLDSIFAQDYQDFRVLIRDAGSTDATCEIIQRYVEKEPKRCELIKGTPTDACKNFAELLRCSTAPLVMFSDHDDVWMPNKITRTLMVYQTLEKEYGAITPLLVFTDSTPVDEQLHEIAHSNLALQNLKAGDMTFPRLLVQNVPYGNTMLFNRTLRELAVPIPRNAFMHDHWLSLTAQYFGRIAFLNESTLFYRQHRNNVFGTFRYSLGSLIRKLMTERQKIRSRFVLNTVQAHAFLECYGKLLLPRDREMLENFSKLPELNFWEKRRVLFKYQIWKTGFLRNIGMLLIV